MTLQQRENGQRKEKMSIEELAENLVRLNEISRALKRSNDEGLYAEWVRIRDSLNERLKPYHLEVLYNAIWMRYCIG